jgi:hypothetical protein
MWGWLRAGVGDGDWREADRPGDCGGGEHRSHVLDGSHDGFFSLMDRIRLNAIVVP